MKLLKTLDKSFLQFLKLVGFSNFLILLKGINNFPWVDSAFSFHFFLSVLSLCCCTGLSLVAENGGYSLVGVHRLLTVVAPLVVQHWLYV